MAILRLTASQTPTTPVFNRRPMAALGATALLLGVALASAPSSVATDADTTHTAPALSREEPARLQLDRRIREGTEIFDQPGYFRTTGDRITFFTDDGKGRLVGLENLNLERVGRAIADNPEQLQWDVTGTITEYRGANFLFVRRAVLKSRVPSLEYSF